MLVQITCFLSCFSVVLFQYPRSQWNSSNHRMLKYRHVSVTKTLLNYTVLFCGMRQSISLWKLEREDLSWKSWRVVVLWENLKSFGWQSIFWKDLTFSTPRGLSTTISNVCVWDSLGCFLVQAGLGLCWRAWDWAGVHSFASLGGRDG